LKNKFILVSICLFLSCEDIGKNFNWSETNIGFSRTYGSIGYDYGWEASYSPFDKGIIITGRTSSKVNGQTDLWAIKTDEKGVAEWDHTFGGSEDDEGLDVISTSDGGFLFIGNSWSFGNNQQIYAIKTDFQGNIIWEQNYGGVGWDVGEAVIETNDGSYLIAGHSNSPSISSGNTDVFLLKIDLNGNLISKNAYGNKAYPNHEWAYDIIQIVNGGFLIVGARDRYSTELKNILVINIDSDYNLVWEKELSVGGFVDETAYSISSTNDGKFIICASINSIENPSNYEPKIIKIDSYGNVEWQRKFKNNGNINNQFRATSTLSGDFVIVGTSLSENSKEDAFLTKIDNNGNILWSYAYGTSDHKDWGWSVFEDPNKNIIFVGSTQSFGASLFDIYLVGVNEEGLSK